MLLFSLAVHVAQVYGGEEIVKKQVSEYASGVSRRQFIARSAAAGFALVCARGVVSAVGPAASSDAGELRQSVFLTITRDGRIQVTTPIAEMGQGAHNALTRIIAAELGAAWDDIDVSLAYADAGFVAEQTGRQRTAASEGVKVYWEQLRRVGASAREMLCTAAADAWSVDAADCQVAESRVVHPASGRAAEFRELVMAASQLPVPAEPVLRAVDQLPLIGETLPRKDIQAKVNGEAVFGIDVQAPGMLHAAMRMPPQAQGVVRSVDDSAALAMPGVVKVVQVEGGVAVLADSFWRAKKAAEALQVEFDPGATEGLDSAAMRQTLQALLNDDDAAVQFPDIDTQAEKPAFLPLDRAVTDAALADADRVLELEYEVPYLAHLTMEPMVCTALVEEGSCTVWAPTQHLDGGRQLVADVTGLPLEKVRLELTFLGGGFGRKFELDTIRQTVQAAQQVPGRPVKLTWTREQDVQHDFYRPAYAVRTRVALTDKGITGMHSRIAGQSIWRFQGKDQIPFTADPTAAALLIYDIYDIPGKYMDFVEAPWRLPVGLWRSVTLSQNAFFAESALDESAIALGRDPYTLRRELLAKHPRIIAVLDRAAELADWDRDLPPGRGKGIALSAGFGSICAQVVEVTLNGDKLSVDRVVCAMDCGLQVDPQNIRAQLEGGIIFGLSAALRGEVTFAGGAVQESNFHDQPILRIHEVPMIELELIDSDAAPGGVGEAGVPPVAPALVNAIHAASGRRFRRLPLSAEQLTLA